MESGGFSKPKLSGVSRPVQLFQSRGSSYAPKRKSGKLKNVKIGLGVAAVILFILLIMNWDSIEMKRTDRVERIQKFNSRVQDWIHYDKTDFLTTMFEIHMNGHTYDLTASTIEIDLYPQCDGCVQEGDPASGCDDGIPVFHSVLVPYSGSYLSSNLRIFGVKSLTPLAAPTTKEEVYTSAELGCSGNACIDICEKQKKGVWSSSKDRCDVVLYLNSVCVQVVDSSDYSFQMVPESVTFRDFGCSYSNDYSPYEYSSTYTGYVHFDVYHTLDPYISASLFTSGCVDNKLNDPKDYKCFGEPFSVYNNTSLRVVFILLLCIVLLALYFVIFTVSPSRALNGRSYVVNPVTRSPYQAPGASSSNSSSIYANPFDAEMNPYGVDKMSNQTLFQANSQPMEP